MKLSTRRASRVVLALRLAGALACVLAYMIFRVYPAADGRIPVTEVVAAGLLVVVLVFVALDAATELIDRRQVLPPSPEPVAPVDGDRVRIHGDLFWTTEAGKRVLSRRVADAPTEPLLFTHEYQPVRSRTELLATYMLTRERTANLFGEF